MRHNKEHDILLYTFIVHSIVHTLSFDKQMRRQYILYIL